MNPDMCRILREPQAMEPPWWAHVERWPADSTDLPNRKGRRARKAEARRAERHNRKHGAKQ